MTVLKSFFYLFFSVVLIFSIFAHSEDQDIYKKLSSANHIEQIEALKALQQTNNMNIYVQVMKMHLSSEFPEVRREADLALNRTFDKTNFNLKAQSELLRIGAANENYTTIEAILSLFMRISIFPLELQKKFISELFENKKNKRTVHIYPKWKLQHEDNPFLQMAIRKILSNRAASKTQQQLFEIATSDSSSETAQDQAQYILVKAKLYPEIQQKLMRIATGFPFVEGNFTFDYSLYDDPEIIQNRAKDILLENNNIDLKTQKELVRITTSDVATVAVKRRASDILIGMNPALETQQELMRIAESDTYFPRLRARYILTEMKSIHPEVARNMNISFKCRRAFRKLIPDFVVSILTPK